MKTVWLAVLWSVALVPMANADERIGPEIPIVEGAPSISEVRLVSDGLGTIAAWRGLEPTTFFPSVFVARVDGAGNVSGPFLISDTSSYVFRQDIAIASDGRTALVVWTEEDFSDRWDIKAVRLGPAGEPLGAAFSLLDRLTRSTIRELRVGFDGVFFRVLWGSIPVPDSRRVYTRRIGVDGAPVSRAKRLRVRGAAAVPFDPRLGCLSSGQCLATWLQTAGTDFVEGVRLRGDTILDSGPLRLLSNARDHVVVGGHHQYLVLGTRSNSGCGQSFCGYDAVAGLVSGDGMVADASGVRVNNPPAPNFSIVTAVDASFDGQNYVAAFLEHGACGSKLYGARIQPDGAVLNPETPGLPLHDAGTAQSAAIAATHTHAFVAWADVRDACVPFGTGAVFGQRALSHPDTSGSVSVEIGAIGPRQVAEQQNLRLRLNASGLNPATTTFSASNLPPGAVFDGATRLFQWRPMPHEAGVYAGVRFEASDGVQSVTEDISIDVPEGALALCGTVERQNAPVPNVAVRIRGGGSKPRTVFSNEDGRFCFYYLIQGPYTLSVGKPSRKQYGASPQRVIMGGSDRTDVRFIVRRLS